MKNSKLMIAVVGILVLTTTLSEECDAQRRGGGMRGGFGRGQQDVSEMSLLAMKEVIQHLKDDFGLEEETMTKISEMAQEVSEELNEERRAAMQDFRSMNDEERQQAFQGMQKAAKERNSSAFKKAKKMLDKKQLKRLAELKIQRMGVAVLQDGLFQDMLKFSEEQTEKINAVRTDYEKSRQEMMDDLRGQRGGDREAMRETMAEMREAMTDMRLKFEKETMGVLSEDQKKKLKELKGEKFKFPQRQGRRPRDI